MSTVRRPRVQREQEQLRAEQDVLTFPADESQPLLATNTGVRLACTIAAMLSPFAVFLCWAERESWVIRRFAVQSAALLVVHLLGAAVLGLITLLVGSVPYFGFLIKLTGWLIYTAVALLVMFFRVRLMERAWHGRKYSLPLLERLISKYY